MRLAACALSAVLLSGCSWLGSGGSYGDSYGYESNGAYSGNCMTGAQGAAYGNSAYGYSGGQVGGMGCAPGAGYNVAYGAGGYGAGMPGGLRGQHGVNAYGTGLQGGGMYGAGAGGAGMYGAGAGGSGMYGAGAGGAGMYGAGAGGSGMYGTGVGGSGMYGTGGGMYGAGTMAYGNSVTTLGSAAPYGSAVGGSGVTTVQGAPIYVAQPYPAYYAAGGGSQYAGGYNYGYSGGGYGGGTLPFGLELGLGQEFGVGGDIFPGEESKTFAGGTGTGTVSDLGSISYKDAWDNAKAADITATYDVNQNTTLLGRVGYSKADGGNQIHVGSITDAGVTEDLYAEFSDLEQYTVEGGVRHYMGAPTGLRPYVGATAGFAHTKDVTLTQSSDTFVDPALYTQTYVDGGWSPTASGVIGAEWAVGGRAALGVETGIRWTDDLDSNFVSDSRLSVPVKLRGRVSF